MINALLPLSRRWHPSRRPLPDTTVGEVLAYHRIYDVDVRRPLTDEQMNELGVAYRLAFLSMLDGRACEDHWAVCVVSLNIALVLAEWGIGENCIPEIKLALDGAFRSKTRANKTGRWGFDGAAIQAIQVAFDIHDEQLLYASKQMLKEAKDEVHRRADAGIAY